MRRAEIIEKIRKRMDEWTPFDATPMLLGANEAMQPISYQIEEVLDTCTDFILRNAPLRCVKSAVVASPAITVVNNTGYVTLPADFLRLNRIMFDDWMDPVQTVYDRDSKIANMQRFPWIRGGRRKPVCVFNEKNGDKILECYSTNGTVTELVYVASSHFDDTDKHFMDDDAIDMLMSYAASVIYNRTNESEFEKIAKKNYELQITNYE